MRLMTILSNPQLANLQNVPMTAAQREILETGRKAMLLHMAEPVFIPGATTTEELAQRKAAMAGKAN